VAIWGRVGQRDSVDGTIRRFAGVVDTVEAVMTIREFCEDNAVTRVEERELRWHLAWLRWLAKSRK